MCVSCLSRKYSNSSIAAELQITSLGVKPGETNSEDTLTWAKRTVNPTDGQEKDH